MTEQLRVRILFALRDQRRTGTLDNLEDSKLVETLGESLQVIQEQLDILGGEGYALLTKTMSPHFRAAITPAGLRYLEALESGPAPKKPMGFM